MGSASREEKNINISCGVNFISFSSFIKIFLRKLYFTTLNYTPYYTLHHKLFECTVCSLHYDFCYTLYPNVNFTVKLNKNMKHVTCKCVLLKWHKLKRWKTPSFQSIKNKFFSTFILGGIIPLPKSKLCSPKFPNQNHLQYHHYFTTATPHLSLRLVMVM